MSQVTAQYDFTATDATDAAGAYAALEIAPLDEGASAYFQTVWQKMANAVVSFHEHCGDGRCPKWTAWQVAKWSKENVTPQRIRFAAWHGDVLAGFVNLRSEYQSSFTQEPITYVEHLAASPGCITTRLWNRSLGRVGQALLAFSVYRSLQNGHGGAIGLHAADDSSVAWYEKLNAKYGNRLFHESRIGIKGFYDRSLQQPYYGVRQKGQNYLATTCNPDASQARSPADPDGPPPRTQVPGDRGWPRGLADAGNV